MSNIQKRYQVFVSSTYEDLKEERMEVLHALLELDCIPCGMEYFPASSESQWKYITQLIDNCDYYMVIVGNRYGSEAEDGKSYTQKEFEYAVEKGIPVIGFLHSDPTSISVKKSEIDAGKQEKLKEFRKAIQKRLCKYWKNSSDLGGVVSRSLMQEIKHNPQIGWVRANELEKLPTNEEIIMLMRENDSLKSKLNISSKNSNKDEPLSDSVILEFAYRIFDTVYDVNGNYTGEKFRTEELIEKEITWEEIFLLVAPVVENGLSASYGYRPYRVATALCSILKNELIGIVTENNSLYIRMVSPSEKQIMEQLIVLGLFSRRNNDYTFTAKGDMKFLKSKALKNGQNRFPSTQKEFHFTYDRLEDNF